jgi:hypothetical protein
MAIGDIFVLPVMATQHRIDLPAFDTDADLNVNYEIAFDRTQWEITAVALSVVAQQTYSIGSNNQASLAIDSFIISQDPNGSFSLGSGVIRWDALDALSVKRWEGGRPVAVQGTPPQKVFIRFNHNYRIALPPITVQSCLFTDYISLVFKSIVASPTSSPTYGSVTQTTTQPPPSGGWDVGSFFGGIGTGVLIAGAAVLALLLLGPGKFRR